MDFDCRKLNEVFHIDGPDIMEYDEDKDFVFSSQYGYGFLGKTHSEESKRLTSLKVSGENNPRYGVVLTTEERKKCRPKSGNKGASNPRAKTFILTSPKGVVYEVVGALKDFCNQHNISFATMHAAILHDRRGPRQNGWTIVEKVKEEIKQDVKADTFSGFKL